LLVFFMMISKSEGDDMQTRFLTIIVMFSILALMPAASMAQGGQPESPRLHYQAALHNPLGEIVPDSNYFMTFRIFSDSTGGTLLWSETHSSVPVRGGSFNAELGSVNPCSLDIFTSGRQYLETQIGDDAIPLSPRVRLGSAPSSASSQRVSGDIRTFPGLIRMFAPQPEPPDDPYMEIRTGVGGEASLVMFAPQPEPPLPEPFKTMEISSSPSSGASFGMSAVQGSYAKQLFGLQTNLSGTEMQFFAPQAGGARLVNNNPQIRLKADSIYSRMLIQRASSGVGGPSESTGVSIVADSLHSTFSLFSNNNPQIRAAASSGGGSMSVFSHGSEYMGIEPSPFNGGGAIRLYDGAGANSFEVTSEGSAGFLNDGSEYMGIEPSPFRGGVINMYDSTGAKSLELASDGSASFHSHGTEYMGIGPSPFKGGVISMYDTTGATSLELASEGSASFFRNGTEYMGVGPSPFNSGGVLTMNGGTPPQPRVILSSEGKLSLGTSITTNIITVQQYSATDPIADGWLEYSSRRWKTNIQPMQGSLAKVMQLQGVTYYQKEGGKHQIGLIAEDVGQIVPEVVAYEDNGVDAKSIDYARLTSLLIESVKEQQKTIEEQNIRIDKLENKIKEMSK
jgi:hypothetical protein